jgi:hypothetical protein
MISVLLEPRVGPLNLSGTSGESVAGRAAYPAIRGRRRQLIVQPGYHLDDGRGRVE